MAGTAPNSSQTMFGDRKRLRRLSSGHEQAGLHGVSSRVMSGRPLSNLHESGGGDQHLLGGLEVVCKPMFRSLAEVVVDVFQASRTASLDASRVNRKL